MSKFHDFDPHQLLIESHQKGNQALQQIQQLTQAHNNLDQIVGQLLQQHNNMVDLVMQTRKELQSIKRQNQQK